MFPNRGGYFRQRLNETPPARGRVERTAAEAVGDTIDPGETGMRAGAAVLLLIGCATPAVAQQAAEASVERGRAVAAAAGCAGCHSIPGVGPGGGNVGPPLASIGRRVYIAGLLPNNASNMRLWVTETQRVRPGDAMPSTQLDARQANDLAAFLETLR
jgi:mono/diheme cytochrome c family protein